MIVRTTILLALSGGAVWLAACASTPSMDQAQCLVADWTTQGYQDAASGHGMPRLDDHIKACAEHGVTPDQSAYHTGHIEGRRVWCVPRNGFALGRRGSSYNQGYCAADLEPAYMVAVADGRTVYDARQHAQRLENRVYETQSRADALAADIRREEDALAAEGLTDEQRSAIRLRIRNLRDDRDQLLYDLGRQQSDADQARYDAARVASSFTSTYGG